MIILPNKNYQNVLNEKITTYQFLSKVSCPVFDSILLEENEKITNDKIKVIRHVLDSDYCTVRYQYVKACLNPVKGGNKVTLTVDNLLKAW